MLGRLKYQYKLRFGSGLEVFWKKTAVRRQILKTNPITDLRDDSCEIHVLTWAQDWLDVMWGLKSLYGVCERRFRLCIHEDGSVPSFGIEALRHHFPDARLIRKPEADLRLCERLRGYPNCAALRSQNVLSLKVFDFSAYLESDRLFLLDSDILFFRRPCVLLDRLTNPTFAVNSLNRDWRHGYTIDMEKHTSQFDFPVQPLINSGLGLMHRDSYQLDWFEEWLGMEGVLGHPHRIEQTLVGLACSRFGHEFLPGEYDVTDTGAPDSAAVKHYTGPIRHLLYKEGLQRAAKVIQW